MVMTQNTEAKEEQKGLNIRIMISMRGQLAVFGHRFQK